MAEMTISADKTVLTIRAHPDGFSIEIPGDGIYISNNTAKLVAMFLVNNIKS